MIVENLIYVYENRQIRYSLNTQGSTVIIEFKKMTSSVVLISKQLILSQQQWKMLTNWKKQK